MTTDLIIKEFPASQVELIRSIAAPKCTDDEFKLLLYQAKTYGLDPLVKQIFSLFPENLYILIGSIIEYDKTHFKRNARKGSQSNVIR
jgi:hypothetical protein